MNAFVLEYINYCIYLSVFCLFIFGNAMQPVALTGGGMWPECVKSPRSRCHARPALAVHAFYTALLPTWWIPMKSSREQLFMDACQKIISTPTSYYPWETLQRQKKKKKSAKRASDEEGCISFGNDGSWQAFLLSMNKCGGRDTSECDIQCTVRVWLADKLTEGIPPTPRARARVSDSIESDRREGLTDAFRKSSPASRRCFVIIGCPLAQVGGNNLHV